MSCGSRESGDCCSINLLHHPLDSFSLRRVPFSLATFLAILFTFFLVFHIPTLLHQSNVWLKISPLKQSSMVVFVPCVTRTLIQSCNVNVVLFRHSVDVGFFALLCLLQCCVSIHCFHGLLLSSLLALGLGFLLALLIFFLSP